MGRIPPLDSRKLSSPQKPWSALRLETIKTWWKRGSREGRTLIVRPFYRQIHPPSFEPIETFFPILPNRSIPFVSKFLSMLENDDGCSRVEIFLKGIIPRRKNARRTRKKNRKNQIQDVTTHRSSPNIPSKFIKGFFLRVNLFVSSENTVNRINCNLQIRICNCVFSKCVITRLMIINKRRIVYAFVEYLNV